MYHRIIDLPSDPWGLCVSPEHFAQQLDVLRRHRSIVPLRRIALGLRDGRWPRDAAAITFDDGYSDNLHHARPILERHGAPATVFITSGLVDGNREFWWDELERLVLQPPVLPRTLCLIVRGEPRRWDLGDAAICGDGEQPLRTWRAWHPAPGRRQALYRALWDLLRNLPDAEQTAILEELRCWAGQAAGMRATHRLLRAAEVASLAGGDLVEIGAHTVSHPTLPSLPPERQAAEIRGSRSACEALSGRAVTSFAYPFGDLAPKTNELVREAGFSLACSTRSDVVAPDADAYALPRVQVDDWDGEEFDRRLKRGFR